MSAFDKTRVFDRNALEELRRNSTELMQTADEVSERMEEEIKALQEIMKEVPSEAKHHGLESTLDRVAGKLHVDDFKDCEDTMQKILTKLEDDIPMYDNKMAEEMGAITQSTAKLCSRINDLTQLAGTGSGGGTYQGFLNKLQNCKHEWDAESGNLSEELKRIQACMKGVELYSSVFSTDPVNLVTGNFIYEKEDLKIKALYPLTFKRFYNAINDREGSLSKGWNHNHEVQLIIEKKTEETEKTIETKEVRILLEDGREEIFSKTAEGNYQEYRGSSSTLTETENSYQYHTTDQKSYTFDGKGNLKRCEDQNGNGASYTYENEQLQKLQSDTGEYLCFHYNDNGKLIRVTDHTNRCVELSYEENRLSKVQQADGTTYQYTYTKKGSLEGVRNTLQVETVKNTYDARNRVKEQHFPDGGVMTYQYKDREGLTILTEQNGNQITYQHDDHYRHTQTRYADGTEKYTYNKRNRKVSHTDKRGFMTRFTYDDRGNLTGIIDPYGSKTSFTYNEKNRPLNIKGPCSEALSHSYDMAGNLISMKDALGAETQVAYTKQGRPNEIRQPDGSMLQIRYDEKGNIKQVTDANGAVTQYGYDDLNRVIETTDGNGNRTQYAYDAKDRIHTVTNAEGNTRTYTYHKNGKVAQILDFDGTSVSLTYNELNKPKSYVDKNGNTTTYAYDLMWNLTEETKPNQATTKYSYNQLNQLETVINPLGGKIRYQYDANGNRTQVTGASGETIRFRYDALNRNTEITEVEVTSEKQEIEHTTKLKYDKSGRILLVTDALGNETHYTYNALGQKISETDALGNETAYTYTVLGQIETIKDAAGRETTYQYENGGRLAKVFYPDGRSVAYTYDANQNIIAKEGNDGYRTTYHYDSLNRITRMESTEGQKKSYTYDAVGNVTGVTDGNGNHTQYSYTKSGKLLKVTDALGNETMYHYDGMDNLIQIEQLGEPTENLEKVEEKETKPGITERENEEVRWLNAKQRKLHLTTYAYNQAGQVERITDAKGLAEGYTYDKSGRLLQKTDKDGNQTTYTYTTFGDMAGIQEADGNTIKMQYDALHRLTQIQDFLGTTNIELDALGRTTEVTDYKERKIGYEWGALGERTAIIYPDERKVQYTYDNTLRLKALIDGGHVISYVYDENSHLIGKQFPNGMKTTYHYDRSGQLESLIHEDGEGILDAYQYHYDNCGNKTAIEKQRRGLDSESGTYAYAYDALHRLIEVRKETDFVRHYQYDGFGNRIGLQEKQNGVQKETSYTYNQMNQLLHMEEKISESKENHVTDICNKSYQYDNRGNLTEVTQNDQLLQRYEFNLGNQLTKIVNPSGEVTTHQYNGLGYRTESITLNGAIQYVTDFTKAYHNLLMQETKDGSQHFVWDGNVVSTGNDTEAAYYMQDELGSPIRFLDDAGNLIDNYGYDEFGQALSVKNRDMNAQRKLSTIQQPFGYTGYQKDKENELYYAHARYYTADSGRFLSEDIIKGYIMATETLNAYGYCWGNPMTLVDLDGRSPVPNDTAGAATILDNMAGSPVPKYTAGAATILEDNAEVLPNASDVRQNKPNIIAEIKAWGEKNIGIDNITKTKMQISGMVIGVYHEEKDTQHIGGNTVTLDYNGKEYESINFNFAKSNERFNVKTGIKLGNSIFPTFKLGITYNDNKDTKFHFSGKISEIGGNIEAGIEKNDKESGFGGRTDFNPLKSIQIYDYGMESKEGIKSRREDGGYINSGVAELALVCIFCPGVIPYLAGLAVKFATMKAAGMLLTGEMGKMSKKNDCIEN